MTWKTNEEDYDEGVVQVILHVLKGMRRVLEGDGSERRR
jgi:hypothetical protein